MIGSPGINGAQMTGIKGSDTLIVSVTVQEPSSKKLQPASFVKAPGLTSSLGLFRQFLSFAIEMQIPSVLCGHRSQEGGDLND